MIPFVIVAAIAGLIVGYFGGHTVGYTNGLEDGGFLKTPTPVLPSRKLVVKAAKSAPKVKPVMARKAPVKAKAAKKRR